MSSTHVTSQVVTPLLALRPPLPRQCVGSSLLQNRKAHSRLLCSLEIKQSSPRMNAESSRREL